MKHIRSYFFYVIALCSCSTPSLARPLQDSLQVDMRWSQLGIQQLAPDGKWMLATEYFVNDPTYASNISWLIHTKESNFERIDFTKRFPTFHAPLLLGGDWVMNNTGAETAVAQHLIQTNLEEPLGLKAQYLSTAQAVLYETADGLALKSFLGKTPKILWSAQATIEYVLSPTQNSLLYRKEKQGIPYLYALDLANGKEKEINPINTTLEKIYWKKDESALVLQQESSLVFIDLEKKQVKNLALPQALDLTKSLLLDMQFYTNNDLYISYSLRNPDVKRNDRLQIWNGNSRDLEIVAGRSFRDGRLPKNLLHFAWVYRQEDSRFIPLERHYKRNLMPVSPNHLLSFNEYEFADYSDTQLKSQFTLEQIEPQKTIGAFAQALPSEMYPSPNGQAILYYSLNEDGSGQWKLWLYKNNAPIDLAPDPHKSYLADKPQWSADGQTLYYSTRYGLFSYSLQTEKNTAILAPSQEKKSIRLIQNFPIRPIHTDTPLYFTVGASRQTVLYRYFKNKTQELYRVAADSLWLTDFKISDDGQSLLWQEQAASTPHRIKGWVNQKIVTLAQTTMPATLYNWLQYKTIHYRDKWGRNLSGTLFYPRNFDATQKYPMITSVYEKESYRAAVSFIMPAYTPGGLNLYPSPYLVADRGYFLFSPDNIVNPTVGPGLSGVACLEAGIAAITQAEPAIAKDKIGLTGQSFGGYITAFVATQSNLFAAAIASCGIYDPIQWVFSFREGHSFPEYVRVEKNSEDYQYKFGSYARNVQKYLDNSPLHQAYKTKTPLLLWAGMEDLSNVPPKYTQNMFLALKREQLPTIALFYKYGGHGLVDYKDRQDVMQRSLDWFDYYLKGKNIPWVREGVDPDLY